MRVVTIGELVVDWLSIQPGPTLSDAKEFHRALGGNATNVAVGLRRLGSDVCLIAKIGNDFHGQYLKDKLASEGIGLDDLFTDTDHPTSQCYMVTTADGHHHFRNWPNPAAAQMLCQEDLRPEQFENAAFLHSTGISLIWQPRRHAIEHAVNLARSKGAAISFDASFPTGAHQEARQHVEVLLYLTHVLKMNEHELNFWAANLQEDTIEKTARRVFEKYQPVALLVTQSAKGSYIVTKDGTAACPPLTVATISEVGAGDAFVAGVLHWLTENMPDHITNVPEYLSQLSLDDWQKAGTAGNVTGACATRCENAYEGMPHQKEFQSLMRSL